jgi:hypothetical protein
MRRGSVVFRMLAALLTTSAAIASGAAHATTVTGVSVDARANVYGGDPGGGGAGVPAISEPLPALTGRTITFSNVLGEVSCCSGSAGSFNGPDGGTYPTNVNTNIGAFDGTSGIVAGGRIMFLVGVFRDADGPGVTAPPSLDFTSAYGNTAFAPLIDQVFFIGDGLTGTGTGSNQTFFVPGAATRLELGFADALGLNGPPGYYDDNVGSLSLDYTVKVVPEPSAALLVMTGLAGLAVRGRWRA